MGEKIVVPPVFPPNSGPLPAPSPTNGNAAEVPLSVEKAYLEQIIENAPEAISIVDQELRILRINGEFTRVFGFTPTKPQENGSTCSSCLLIATQKPHGSASASRLKANFRWRPGASAKT